MSAFNEHQFEKRLQLLKDSQDSIQSLSSWCLQHRQHHKKIVGCWLRVLKKANLHNWRLFLHLHPEETPCRGDRDPPNMDDIKMDLREVG
ncbi:Regulation of nuclear pre-mRNA domain-containing protein 1A [Zootermopsis nevadensis]|uniref:Regulation of nuclear pre-mRNA domain-containing protein 1A n=1 Tax=Zootermopsis nevadensis TaxID=136037 RepID=A0A067QTM6_ZOONE|nr:Regulation of nuclear pre-mRNA domain-containing protein 1A [Zootermopsis nevadensis]